MNKLIVIVQYPLSYSSSEIFAMSQNNESLIDAIVIKKQKLLEDGVETFTRKENIIVTSAGYYAAFYVRMTWKR